MNKYLEAGKIRNVHGVNGNMIVESFCDSVDVFCSLKRLFLYDKSDNDYHSVDLSKNQKMSYNTVLIHIKGIESRETAMIYKSMTVYADRDDLPALKPETNYIADLIGLKVIDAKSQVVYGVISDVVNYGASDIYEIKNEDDKLFYFPAVKEYIVEIDLNKGVIINPIEGMFDDI